MDADRACSYSNPLQIFQNPNQTIELIEGTVIIIIKIKKNLPKIKIKIEIGSRPKWDLEIEDRHDD